MSKLQQRSNNSEKRRPPLVFKRPHGIFSDLETPSRRVKIPGRNARGIPRGRDARNALSNHQMPRLKRDVWVKKKRIHIEPNAPLPRIILKTPHDWSSMLAEAEAFERQCPLAEKHQQKRHPIAKGLTAQYRGLCTARFAGKARGAINRLETQ